MYSLPSTERLWKKAPFGSSSKERLVSFAEAAGKKKSWVPSPDKYKTTIGEWSRLKMEGGKFNKEVKTTMTEAIYKKSK